MSKKPIDTTPFTEAEVQELIDTHKASDKVVKFKPVDVLNHDTDTITWWIRAKMKESGKWLFVVNTPRAVVFADKKTANRVCRIWNKMQEEI